MNTNKQQTTTKQSNTLVDIEVEGFQLDPELLEVRACMNVLRPARGCQVVKHLLDPAVVNLGKLESLSGTHTALHLLR